MTGKTVIELACEAGLNTGTLVSAQFDQAYLEAFAALVRQQVIEELAGVDVEPVFFTRKKLGVDREFCEKPFTTDWQPLYTTEAFAAVRLRDREKLVDVSDKYQELLTGVSKKFPNESLHDTAKRYIYSWEGRSVPDSGIAAAAVIRNQGAK